MTEEQIALRGRAYRRIQAILVEAGLAKPGQFEACADAELVRATFDRCLNEANIYCALTGDDSLISPPVRACRQAMVDGLGDALAAAKRARERAATGMGDMF